ncbi:MAG: ATP phosphoribosyltransferase regulatory subunit [Candidatus Competibacteraceae bacterium]
MRHEQVIPPFVEFLDALLTSTGNDLDLQTFKLTDQVSGRLLGVRAIADPRSLASLMPVCGKPRRLRFCYLHQMLRTRGSAVLISPIQIGAELYGHGSCKATSKCCC